MGILDTTVETFSSANEREMRKEYLNNWIRKHTPKTSKDIGITTGVKWFSGKSGYLERKHEFHVVTIKHQVSIPNQNIKCLTLDAPLVIDGGKPCASINLSNKINFKPEPNHRYAISDITDSDLSLFELRTIDKQGGILYCIDCTKNIANKSKKWKYYFFRTCPDGSLVPEL